MDDGEAGASSEGVAVTGEGRAQAPPRAVLQGVVAPALLRLFDVWAQVRLARARLRCRLPSRAAAAHTATVSAGLLRPHTQRRRQLAAAATARGGRGGPVQALCRQRAAARQGARAGGQRRPAAPARLRHGAGQRLGAAPRLGRGLLAGAAASLLAGRTAWPKARWVGAVRFAAAARVSLVAAAQVQLLRPAGRTGLCARCPAKKLWRHVTARCPGVGSARTEPHHRRCTAGAPRPRAGVCLSCCRRTHAGHNHARERSGRGGECGRRWWRSRGGGGGGRRRPRPAAAPRTAGGAVCGAPSRGGGGAVAHCAAGPRGTGARACCAPRRQGMCLRVAGPCAAALVRGSGSGHSGAAAAGC